MSRDKFSIENYPCLMRKAQIEMLKGDRVISVEVVRKLLKSERGKEGEKILPSAKRVRDELYIYLLRKKKELYAELGIQRSWEELIMEHNASLALKRKLYGGGTKDEDSS